MLLNSCVFFLPGSDPGNTEHLFVSKHTCMKEVISKAQDDVSKCECRLQTWVLFPGYQAAEAGLPVPPGQLCTQVWAPQPHPCARRYTSTILQIILQKICEIKKKKKKGWKTQQIWIQCSSVQFSFIKGFSLAQQLFLGLHMRVNTWGSYSSYRSATLRSWLCRKRSWCFGGVFFSAQPGCRQPGVFLERIEHLLLPHCRRDETMITIVCIQ